MAESKLVVANYESEATETDSLLALEERIHRTVDLVTSARDDRERAYKERDKAIAEKHAAVQALETVRAERDQAIEERNVARSASGEVASELHKLRTEIENLRGERKQVRARIEKLLGQIDQLGGQ